MIKKYNDYLVSSDGKIYRNEKELKLHENSKGYLRFPCSVNGKVKQMLVHRVVAELYIPNPENKPQVNHIDGNKHNNNINNLEWCTNRENQNHAIKLGLKKSVPKGDKNAKAKAVRMYNNNEEKTFNSLRSALEYLGKPYSCYSSIAHCCKGDTNTAYGYKWEYI